MLDLEYIETVLKAKEGFEFQRYSVRYLRNKHGYDFQAVDSKGRLGDRGKDGYIFKTREFFAMSSQVKNLSDKVRRDFKNCMEKNLEVLIFTFVTNQKIGPKECDTRDALQRQYPDTEFRFLQHGDIAAELLLLSNREILIILRKSVPILADNTIYFKENIEKQMSFTLLESVKDSLPWYLAAIVICVMAGAVFFIFLLTGCIFQLK
ncbi:hypothetical protein [Chryseobacterium indologenes]|uniref:Restriction endonuclease type IV Mrr domain-containing protein n=1 Tax=Chryseobacterium indologenes TaxID=253 RepID=A0A0N1KSM1_CHRID|nr:hypothetical protein [Chryseobacterium indologenes]KPE49086.1 hypothetical protein AOB46_21815 [Chryseobacterium indologenes]